MRRLGQRQRQGPSRRNGCAKKNGPQAIGKSRGGWTTKIHLVAANDRIALTVALSPGQALDAVEGRRLLESWHDRPTGIPMLVDRAYEGDETRQRVSKLGFEPVVPPKSNRREPWQYDRNLYRRRNEAERLFRRLEDFRRLFSRFDKLDIMFKTFINFALIIEMICVNRV